MRQNRCNSVGGSAPRPAGHHERRRPRSAAPVPLAGLADQAGRPCRSDRPLLKAKRIRSELAVGGPPDRTSSRAWLRFCQSCKEPCAPRRGSLRSAVQEGRAGGSSRYLPTRHTTHRHGCCGHCCNCGRRLAVHCDQRFIRLAGMRDIARSIYTYDPTTNSFFMRCARTEGRSVRLRHTKVIAPVRPSPKLHSSAGTPLT